MLYKRGKVWWIQYYRRGKLFRESCRSLLKSIATALLKIREGDAAAGRMPTLHAEMTTFEDLVQLHSQNLTNNGKETRRADHYIALLNRSFADLMAG
ncbi:MAG: hypothetical protein ACYC9L_14870 [Sulfuricaulis sp.]